MAALTLTYDDLTSRVLLAATSLPATADVAGFETSIDNIHWTTVRGGDAVTVASGAASVYDYEFAPGQLNYYRVSAVDLALPSFVAAGTAATANNGSVAPGLPAGITEGDLLVIWAAIRNSGTGSITVPAGWTAMLRADNIALLGRRATSSESAPTVNISGGAAGADVIGQMAAYRNAELTPVATAVQLNPSGQNIDYPALAAVDATWGAALILGWKQDDWTSVAALAGATEIGETVSTAGNDAGMVWDHILMSTPAAVGSGAFVVTGGASAISYGASVVLRSADYVTQATNTITPAMTECWLKFPSAPYLNRTVTLTDWHEIRRTSRMGFYTVVAKIDAIASTDTSVPRTVTINLFAHSDAEVAAIDLVLSVGHIMLFHIPSNVALKSLYAGTGTVEFRRPSHLSHRGTYTIPLTEVSQPDLAVVGNLVTWATLITRYTSWQDVINANATWSDVLALTGSPEDALVGL
ncbi:MAG: hypothetical protein ACRDTZ_06365 [Pseudonocardiaceae bacterium]